MSWKNKSVLITGAGRGLGRAFAEHVALSGARVVLVARTGEELEATRAGILTAGGEAHAIRADIADKDAVFRIAGLAADAVGPIDVLVHAAATLGVAPLRPLLDTDCEALERALMVNTVGPFRLTKIVAGAMAIRERGLVVHITSDARSGAYEGWGPYGASKAATDLIHHTWAGELERAGVRFVSVDPGEMATLMHREALPDADESALREPADVARVIAELVDPELVREAWTDIAVSDDAIAQSRGRAAASKHPTARGLP